MEGLWYTHKSIGEKKVTFFLIHMHHQFWWPGLRMQSGDDYKKREASANISLSWSILPKTFESNSRIDTCTLFSPIVLSYHIVIRQVFRTKWFLSVISKIRWYGTPLFAIFWAWSSVSIIHHIKCRQSLLFPNFFT